MENMKSADSSQFPWQRRAVPAHSALLLSTEPRPLPLLLPQFSSFSSASSCFCPFFSPTVVVFVCGAAIPLASLDMCPPPQLFLLHSAFPFLSSFNVPYFLLSLPSLPPLPSFLIFSGSSCCCSCSCSCSSPKPKFHTPPRVLVPLK